MNLRVAYTYIDSTFTDRTGEEDITQRRDYIPRHRIALNADYAFSRQLLLGAGFDYVGDREGTYTVTGKQDMENYYLLRAYGEYDVNEDLKVTARLENILDDDYDATAGFPARGVGAFVGLTIRF